MNIQNGQLSDNLCHMKKKKDKLELVIEKLRIKNSKLITLENEMKLKLQNRCQCRFDVKEIIEERIKKQKGKESKKEYLVEWKHTWIPEENLDCSAALKRFLRALNYLKKLKIKRLNDLKNKRQKEEQKTIRSNKTNVLNK